MTQLKQGISLIINTKNEAVNITKCIKSTEGLVDEIIVADMNSQDDTVSIAKSLGAKVISVPEYGFAEPARNRSVKEARYTWILVLDADEKITESLKEKLRKIVKENKHQVIQIPRKNIIFNKWIKHTFWWPDYQIRFFKKGKVKWQNYVHTKPITLGEIHMLAPREEYAIEHINIKWYKNTDGILDMIKSYAKLTDFEHSLLNKTDLTPTDFINYMKGEFEFRFIQNEGYLDNMHGFILSKFMEFYRLAEISYFWEKKGFPKMFSDEALKNAVEKTLNPENELLIERLKKIEASKFYKVWRFYCKYRDMIMGKN